MNTTPIFDRISKKYDFLNHLFSLNIDKIWRRQGVQFVDKELNLSNGPYILDLACGTGDLSLALLKKGAKVEGIDLSDGMLNVAEKKCAKFSDRITFKIADASDLPYPSSTFDCVTIAYGIRNFDDRGTALNQIFRTIRPGGLLMILEFASPTNKIIKAIYTLYFKYILPFLAKLFTLGKEKGAYRYFVNSVEKFPKFEKFCSEIQNAGFVDVNFKKQSFGISVLYSGRKPY